MHFTLAIAALVATATASGLVQRDIEYNKNASCESTQPLAKVVNRCSYPVYIWSIGKQFGCPTGTGLKLNTGEFYNENFDKEHSVDDSGISIKISKFEECGGKDITQLEYKISTLEKYKGNYLDMSFVDCTGNPEDCPGRTDGFYLKSGNQDGMYPSGVNNEHCPVFNVYDAKQAAEVSYIHWDDPQTKFCNEEASLELYLCGGHAPGADDTPVDVPSVASSASQAPSSSSASLEPKPTSAAPVAPSSTEEAYIVAAAAVTKAPSVAAAAPAVKTEIVYVTEYVNKRHAHGRRHQHYRA